MPSRLLDTKPRIPTKILLAAVCDLQIERARDFSRKYGFLAAYRERRRNVEARESRRLHLCRAAGKHF